MNESTKFMVGAVGLGVVAYVLYRGASKVGEVAGNAAAAVGTAANAVNPLNHDNIFATGVNNIGAAVSGTPDFSLGGWLFDVFNPDQKPYASGAAFGADAKPATGDGYASGAMWGGTPSGNKYAATPATTNGAPSGYFEAPALGLWGGASFKDLSDPYDVNGFRNIMPVPSGPVY